MGNGFKTGLFFFTESVHSCQVKNSNRAYEGLSTTHEITKLQMQGSFSYVISSKMEDCFGGPPSKSCFAGKSACRSPMYLGVGPGCSPRGRAGDHSIGSASPCIWIRDAIRSPECSKVKGNALPMAHSEPVPSTFGAGPPVHT